MLLLSLAFASAALAQLTNVTADQAVPTPAAGHDYIHLLSETVNPADGSVSVKINVPLPQSRGLTLPFSFAYDSNGVHHLTSFTPGNTNWVSNTSLFSQGGWAYTVPVLSLFGFVWKDPLLGNCFYNGDYVFQDPAAGRHPLYLATPSTTESACSGAPVSSVYSGQDDLVSATTSPMQGTTVPPRLRKASPIQPPGTQATTTGPANKPPWPRRTTCEALAFKQFTSFVDILGAGGDASGGRD